MISLQMRQSRDSSYPCLGFIESKKQYLCPCEHFSISECENIYPRWALDVNASSQPKLNAWFASALQCPTPALGMEGIDEGVLLQILVHLQSNSRMSST